MDTIFSRRSIRKFKDAPVELFLLGKVLNAGFLAPTAGNLQDFRFMVVTDPALKNGIAQACLDQLWIARAPQVIVIFSEFTKTKRFYGIRGERLYTIQDCAAAAMNMLLAAHDLGLGACWVGAFDEDRICSVLGVPDYARPQVVIPIGYPDEEVPMPPKFKLEQLVYFNSWGDNSGKVIDVYLDMFKDWAPTVTNTAKGAINAIDRGSQTIGEKVAHHAKKLHGHIKKKIKGSKNSKKSTENKK